MAENRAAFSLRRRCALGFSKCRWFRTVFKVPSRSIFFFKRRKARSTGSPFLNLISVKPQSLPLYISPEQDGISPFVPSRPAKDSFPAPQVSTGKTGRNPMDARAASAQSRLR
jgi:hypothetical protein